MVKSMNKVKFSQSTPDTYISKYDILDLHFKYIISRWNNINEDKYHVNGEINGNTFYCSSVLNSYNAAVDDANFHFIRYLINLSVCIKNDIPEIK